MRGLRRKLEVLVVFALALGCCALAEIWPQWQSELQGYGYYGQLPARKPYIKYCFVWAQNDPGGMYTSLDVAASTPDLDMSGGGPLGSDYSLHVDGPNGFNYTFLNGNPPATPSDYVWSVGEYWHQELNLPEDGLYTFTVTDNRNGDTATSYFYLTVGDTIPLPDAAAFNASGDPLSPTLSWSAISDYNGTLFYRARVFDLSNNIVWTSSRQFNTTSVTVPSGRLVPGWPYTWRAEAYDNHSGINSDNRSNPTAIPLVTDDTRAYFNSVAVFMNHNIDTHPMGSVTTGLHATVGDPSGSNSTLVVNGPGGFTYIFGPSDCSAQPNFTVSCLAFKPNTIPLDGLYTFTATNSAGDTVSSFYLTSYEVPLVDPATCQASGDPTGPVLSWNAPETANRPLYYQTFIWNTSAYTLVWSSPPGVTTNTSVSVPPGTLASLPPGDSIQWHVIAYDGRYGFKSNQSISMLQELSIQNSNPYFIYANVHDRNEPSGHYMKFHAKVADPDGTIPNTIKSVIVTDPSSISHNATPNYDSVYNEFWYQSPGTPEVGKYIFTVTDTNDNSATTYKYHRQGEGTIPLLDETSFQVSGIPLAPTISWSAVKSSTGPDYPVHLYYHVLIEEITAADLGEYVYSSSYSPESYTVVPSGKLLKGKSYRYRVEATDALNNTASDNRAVSSWHLLLPPVPGNFSGDFNGDGKTDTLLFNSSTGQVYIWLMDGTTIAGQGSPWTLGPSSPWQIVAVGDFNGDGKSDILLFNSSTGQVYIWLMDGTTIAGQGSPWTLGPSSPWQIAGVGDFNGDGKSDILLHQSSTGQVYLWLMDGTTISDQGSPWILGTDSPWQIVGHGDFNGDGNEDILLFNSSSGQVYTWLMNGTTISDQGSVWILGPGSTWQIAGVGDFNGDGKSDILLFDSSTGQVYTWLMNGTTLSDQGSVWILGPGSPWQIMN
jgi:hypothetical protein